MNNYPKDLQKKVTLLQHFKNFLEGEKMGTNKDKEKPTLVREDNSKKSEEKQG